MNNEMIYKEAAKYTAIGVVIALIAFIIFWFLVSPAGAAQLL